MIGMSYQRRQCLKNQKDEFTERVKKSDVPGRDPLDKCMMV